MSNTISAPSLSQSDVQSAINSAGSGDTVSLPAGSATWSASITITKPVIVLGAGQGKTNITVANGGSGFYLKCPIDARIEIGLLSLTSGSNQQGFGITMDNSGTLLNSIVIRDIDFKGFYSAYQNGTVANSAGFGVCARCKFWNCKIPTRHKGFLKSLSASAVGNVPSPAWGTAAYMVVEDCHYVLDQDAWEFYLADTDGPMNVIFRFTTVDITHSSGWTESGWDEHGNNDGGNENACRNGYGTIAHDNVFNVSGGAQVDKLADIRGGVGNLIFNNTVTGSSSPNSVRNVIRANAFTDDRTSITPTKTYFDKNTSNGNPVQLQNDGTGGQEGTNYFNNKGLPQGYKEIAHPHPLLSGSTPPPNPTPPPKVQDGTVIPVAIGQNPIDAAAGTYQLVGTVTAPSGDKDSLWIDFDSDPTGDNARCWDMTTAAQPTEQAVTWRGVSGKKGRAAAPAKEWVLSAGPHVLYIAPREPAGITKVKFINVAAPPVPPDPVPATRAEAPIEIFTGTEKVTLSVENGDLMASNGTKKVNLTNF
jgi:hypothetical protein